MNNEKTLYKTTRVIWYVFYVLEALLLFRFILKLLGANAAAGFTNFIYSLSYVPLAPFRLVFGTNSVGGSTLEWNRPLDEREAERGLEMQDNTQ